MKFFRILSSVLCVVICGVAVLPSRVSAVISSNRLFATRSVYNPFSVPIIKELGSISVKRQIECEKVYDLYCTFDDPKDAIDKLYDAVPNILALLEKHYKLGRMDIDNWEEYREAMYDFADSENCPIWLNEENIEYRKLHAFFDIIENDMANQRILKIANSARANCDTVNSLLYQELLYLLPYHEISEDFDLEFRTGADLNGYAGFNETKGIAYAYRHATNRNTAQYRNLPKDCTNFVSQILENGDIAQVVYDDRYKGWWHKRSVGFLGVVTYSHSNSWSVADTFARYMGVSYTTTNHLLFTCNVIPGDFIAFDRIADGNWDHMGFITETKKFNNNICYDYKVAQHSTDYHLWWSSFGNGWEMIEQDSGRYARVRRPN